MLVEINVESQKIEEHAAVVRNRGNIMVKHNLLNKSWMLALLTLYNAGRLL